MTDIDSIHRLAAMIRCRYSAELIEHLIHEIGGVPKSVVSMTADELRGAADTIEVTAENVEASADHRLELNELGRTLRRWGDDLCPAQPRSSLRQVRGLFGGLPSLPFPGARL